MYFFAVGRPSSQDTSEAEQAEPSSAAQLSHIVAGMENDGYEAGDEDQRSVPTSDKKTDPSDFDDVDLSISAHKVKAKTDVEAANGKTVKTTEGGGEQGVPTKWFLFVVALLAVGFIFALALGLTLGHPDPRLAPFQFFQGAVVSDHRLCSEVGRDILKNGGIAVDAAVATAFCVGVLNLHTAGIGGGGFLTAYQRGNESHPVMAFDAQVAAPMGSDRDMFAGDKMAASKGGLAIAVPGEVAGLYMAHKELGGMMSWASLLEPSIRLAKGGFNIGQTLADAIAANEQDILADPYFREILVNDFGNVKVQGDRVHLPKLATTLEAIAAKGSEAFYKGDLAQQIVEDVLEAGGNITLEDLKNYTALRHKPLSVELGGGQLYGAGGVMVYAPPPPSSGVLTNYILNILEGYDLNWRSISDTPDEVSTYHNMLEAFKFAFAEQGNLGDPRFVEKVNKKYTDKLMSSKKAKEIRSLILVKALPLANYSSKYARHTDLAGGATHISVQDKDGNAVSFTSSLSLDFGSKKRGNRTGIMFNAGMGDFTLPEEAADADGLKPSPANYIQPRKRPLSSMTPLVLVDNDGVVKAVMGASGGTEMITSTAMMAAQTLWFEENVIDAMDRKRLHCDLKTSNGVVVYDHEKDLDTAIISGLTSREQVDSETQVQPSSVNLIMQTKKNRFYTNSDPRVLDSGYALY